MQSSRELYENQIAAERDEIEAFRAEEEEEARLIYEAKGIDAQDARHLAHRIMTGDPQVALDTMAREELGADPDELGGSAWVAALASFVLFTLGGGVSLPVRHSWSRPGSGRLWPPPGSRRPRSSASAPRSPSLPVSGQSVRALGRWAFRAHGPSPSSLGIGECAGDGNGLIEEVEGWYAREAMALREAPMTRPRRWHQTLDQDELDRLDAYWRAANSALRWPDLRLPRQSPPARTASSGARQAPSPRSLRHGARPQPASPST